MIASGEKKEEYRELKDYWYKRLGYRYDSDRETGYYNHEFTEFDIVRFRNGYSKDAPAIDIKCEGIRIDYDGKREWGYVGKCFIIELGEIISMSNSELNPERSVATEAK